MRPDFREKVDNCDTNDPDAIVALFAEINDTKNAASPFLKKIVNPYFTALSCYKTTESEVRKTK